MDTATVSSAIANLSTAFPAPAASEPTSTLWSVFSFFYNFIFLVHRIVVALVTFSTFTVPTWLFMLFSTSLTVTMNFTTLLLIAFAIGSGGVWFVRYRLLNMYPTLPHEPQRKEPEIDLFPDSQGGDSKPGLSNYLDEFLSAIKIFGYLERPVFHELTRHIYPYGSEIPLW